MEPAVKLFSAGAKWTDIRLTQATVRVIPVRESRLVQITTFHKGENPEAQAAPLLALPAVRELARYLTQLADELELTGVQT